MLILVLNQHSWSDTSGTARPTKQSKSWCLNWTRLWWTSFTGTSFLHFSPHLLHHSSESLRFVLRLNLCLNFFGNNFMSTWSMSLNCSCHTLHICRAFFYNSHSVFEHHFVKINVNSHLCGFLCSQSLDFICTGSAQRMVEMRQRYTYYLFQFSIVKGRQTDFRVNSLQKSGIDKLLPHMKIDDYLFDPCGYSMNGVLQNVRR